MLFAKSPRNGWRSSPKSGGWGPLFAIVFCLLILSAFSFSIVQAGTNSEFSAYMLPRPLSATTYENILILRRDVKKISNTTVDITWDNGTRTQTSFSPTVSGGSEYLYLPVPVGVKAATVIVTEGQYQVTFTPKLPENSEFTVKVVRSGNFPYPSRNVVEIYRRVLISATVEITTVTTPHTQQTGRFEAIAPLFESQTRYIQLPDDASAVTVTVEEAGKTFVYPLQVNPIVPTPTPTETPITGATCEYWAGRPDRHVGWVYGYVRGVTGAGAHVVAQLNNEIVGCQTTREGGLLPFMPLYRLTPFQTGEYKFFVDGIEYAANPEVSIESLEGGEMYVELSPLPAPTLILKLVTHGETLERPNYFSISLSTFGEPMEYFFHGEGELAPISFTEPTIVDYVKQIDLPEGWAEESTICQDLNGLVTMPFILANGNTLSCVATVKKLEPTPTATLTPSPTATQTPEPTATATMTPSPTPTIIPTAAPTQGSAFTVTVPSSVNAAEIFTATAKLDVSEALTGEAQILISVSQDLIGLTPRITVTGTANTEELGITHQHLAGIFPDFKCGDQTQSAETHAFTVLAIKIAHSEKLLAGNQITVAAPFQAISASGVVPANQVWANGAFLSSRVNGSCLILALPTQYITVLQPGAQTQRLFLPIINR